MNVRLSDMFYLRRTFFLTAASVSPGHEADRGQADGSWCDTRDERTHSISTVPSFSCRRAPVVWIPRGRQLAGISPSGARAPGVAWTSSSVSWRARRGRFQLELRLVLLTLSYEPFFVYTYIIIPSPGRPSPRHNGQRQRRRRRSPRRARRHPTRSPFCDLAFRPRRRNRHRRHRA